MEIIRGSLDDISRPASCEQTGSRVSSVSLHHSDRICPTTPFALVVLTNDAADTDEEKEDFELQRAIEEMRQLDEILSAEICKEKEVKRQRKELQAKLWEELLVDTVFTVLLTFVAFLTGEKRPNSLTESFEVGHGETGEEQFEGSHCGASKGKKKQRDFVKRNIEVCQSSRQAKCSAREDMWAVSVLTRKGYTPEPSDLEQLINIDSKIRLLLPVEEFLSVQSSYTNLSMSQVCIQQRELSELSQDLISLHFKGQMACSSLA
uniref:Fibrous sheath-interacting protein 1 n=1 Tax=Dicentrarchus labrax TaxID=13489 RepID=A0A8C4E4M4_DICLA